ncbi:MAG: hypothetical protein J6A63_01985 [Clostridia bacterium]|nr:hypothetical protein [Clostridia bacterium]
MTFGTSRHSDAQAKELQRLSLTVILRATLEESHGRKCGLAYKGIFHFAEYDVCSS